jgi:dTDP-4-dehydrorhamnose 3,5-epimerase
MFDVFISHAYEDKAAIARPLAEALRARGWSVWFDEFQVALGDSLRQSIDRGLAEARYGVVILSRNFFAKRWTRRELDGLVAREIAGENQNMILPVWHDVDQAYVAGFSPALADRRAVPSTAGIAAIVDEIEFVLQRTPRTSASAPSSRARSFYSLRQTSATRLEGPVIVKPQVYGDERGFFTETYQRDAYSGVGIDIDFVQDNQSRSRQGVVRGMHFQPGQAKLIRCARGRIVDVLVDIRPASATFGLWEAYELSDENGHQVYCPDGFAHGFCVVSDVADVIYKISTYYDPAAESGFRYDDPAVAIEWPQIKLTASLRDQAAPLLAGLRLRQ